MTITKAAMSDGSSPHFQGAHAIATFGIVIMI